MNKIDFTKIYGYIGKVLCGIAGGIIAFVVGNIYWAIPGIFAGFFVAHFLERQIVSQSFKKS